LRFAIEPSARIEVAPGAVWLRGFLSIDEQLTLASEALSYLDAPAGGYVPVVRGGGRMHVRMVCLGRHWNALTYRYAETREDFDNLPVAPLPESWRQLATRAAAEAGFQLVPDICIVNSYGADGRMGLHQDKDESAPSIASGVPVVSISLGDTARFLFGGLRRRDPVEPLLLESGDGFVFGGPARLRFHGVSRIVPDGGPARLSVTGRINLTFRQY
jgi:alkylated DNA repair protein (DNA oxidative demethylase)